MIGGVMGVCVGGGMEWSCSPENVEDHDHHKKDLRCGNEAQNTGLLPVDPSVQAPDQAGEGEGSGHIWNTPHKLARNTTPLTHTHMTSLCTLLPSDSLPYTEVGHL